MKYFGLMMLVGLVCGAATAYNEFQIADREATKCESCKYFMQFYGNDLSSDDIEQEYREFYELAQGSEEDICSNFCVNEEFVGASESAESSENIVESNVAKPELAIDSSENVVENLLAHVGCPTCMHIVNNVNKHVTSYRFRNIIQAFKWACFHEVSSVCNGFLTHHEDNLIDAIYHFKSNGHAVCQSIHQC